MHERDTRKIRHNLSSIQELLTQGDRHGLIEYRHGGAEPRCEVGRDVEDRDKRDDRRYRRVEAGWRDEERDEKIGDGQRRVGAGWCAEGPSQ